MMIGLGISIDNNQVLGGYTPLLDSYDSAQTAWFIPAQLFSSYTGNAIRIRRASDDAETNIPYSSGLLDESAISAHCGVSEGFLVTAYDQRGNNNDWTQATENKQPKIYDGSAVIKIGSYPAMESDNTASSQGNLSVTITGAATTTAFHILKDAARYSVILSGQSGSYWYGEALSGGAGTPQNNAGTPLYYDNGDAVTSADTGDIYTSVNGHSIMSLTSLNISTWTEYNTEYESSDTISPIKHIQGAIIYDSDQSSNRTAIESAINGFLSIY